MKTIGVLWLTISQGTMGICCCEINEGEQGQDWIENIETCCEHWMVLLSDIFFIEKQRLLPVDIM